MFFWKSYEFSSFDTCTINNVKSAWNADGDKQETTILIVNVSNNYELNHTREVQRKNSRVVPATSVFLFRLPAVLK